MWRDGDWRPRCCPGTRVSSRAQDPQKSRCLPDRREPRAQSGLPHSLRDASPARTLGSWLSLASLGGPGGDPRLLTAVLPGLYLPPRPSLWESIKLATSRSGPKNAELGLGLQWTETSIPTTERCGVHLSCTEPCSSQKLLSEALTSRSLPLPQPGVRKPNLLGGRLRLLPRGQSGAEDRECRGSAPLSSRWPPC